MAAPVPFGLRCWRPDSRSGLVSLELVFARKWPLTFDSQLARKSGDIYMAAEAKSSGEHTRTRQINNTQNTTVLVGENDDETIMFRRKTTTLLLLLAQFPANLARNSPSSRRSFWADREREREQESFDPRRNIMGQAKLAFSALCFRCRCISSLSAGTESSFGSLTYLNNGNKLFSR